jgi:hypothetical protein
MLDAIDTIFVFASAAVILVAMTRRLIVAGIAGAWFGLAIVAAASGAFDGKSTGPLVVLFLFAFPLVVAALAWLRPSVRAVWLAIPMQRLIGLNVIRSIGFMFLLLAADGRLSGPFPYSAGWGDVITGVFALPVALSVARGTASRARIVAWNAFGLLDLIAAVSLGVVSQPGSNVQLLHVGVGSTAITHLPYSLIPTALVPFFIVTHLVIFAQLRARAPRRVAAVATMHA